MLLSIQSSSCFSENLDGWQRAEQLGHDIMFNLINFAQGWVDWSLLLNEAGSTSKSGNRCDAPLIAVYKLQKLTVQPKFHYLGHFSKYVIPGSIRVDSTVVGDFGYEIVDPLVHANVELGIFGCEKSSRQMWSFHPDQQAIELYPLTIQSLASSDTAQLCIARGGSRKYLRLMDCNSRKPDVQFVKVAQNTHGQIIDIDTGNCFTVAGDNNEVGSLLELTTCSVSPVSPSQLFRVDSSTGEISIGNGNADNRLCLTAGWPFLNAVAFTTPKDDTVVVVMNESPTATVLSLTDTQQGEGDQRGKAMLTFAIRSRAVQTVIY